MIVLNTQKQYAACERAELAFAAWFAPGVDRVRVDYASDFVRAFERVG